MGAIIPFNRPSASVRAKPLPATKSRKRSKRSKPVYIGLNIYVDPEPDPLLQKVKRGALHGILSAWGWHVTKGLFRSLFVTGGVFRIRCKASDALDIAEQIDLRVPDLLVRRVRRAA